MPSDGAYDNSRFKRTKARNLFLSYSLVAASLVTRLPLDWDQSGRKSTRSALSLPVCTFVACLAYCLFVFVGLWFVLCLERCLFYDSATWAQTAAKDKAAFTGGLFLQPLSHKAISHPS